jgi:hypothetical protein
MKKLLPLCVLVLAAFAANSAFAFTPFTTIAQAEQYCPALDNLTFKPVNPSNPHSIGTINGEKKNINFKSDSGAMHPKYLDANNIIQDVQFRNTNGIYGYISGNNTVCLYSYPGFTGVSVALILEGYSNGR